MNYATATVTGASKVQVTTRERSVHATQRREFNTVVGRGRSVSLSTAHGTYTETTAIHPDGSRVVTQGAVTRGDDSGRSHTHPGDTAHTPGAGFYAGTTTTPAQRAVLDSAGSTVSPSTRGAWIHD